MAFPSPVAVALGAVGPGVLAPVVGSGVPVGADVGAVEGVVAPADGLVEAAVGVFGAESDVAGVEGVVLGAELLDPDDAGDDESGFCDGVVPWCVPLPPEYCCAGWSCAPPLWPGSLVNTLLW